MMLVYDTEEAAMPRSAKGIVDLLMKAKEAYYSSGKPIMEDSEFDALEDKLRKLDPKNSYFKKVGAKIKTGAGRPKKARLPYKMGSLSKVKSSDAIVSWVGKSGTVDVSDKLDGLSLEIVSDKVTGEVKAYTRGDGAVGQDVTHILSHVRGVGKLRKGQAIRCEAVVGRKRFAEKHANDFANPRNLVSGIINSAGINPNIKSVTLVVHGSFNPKRPLSSVASQLKAAGWIIAKNQTLPAKGIDEELPKLLEKRKRASLYDIDGLVLTMGDDQVAFKGADEKARVTVDHVEWNLSRYGLWKPVIILAGGQKLAGATVTRATAHNAKFISDNKIGKGAVIEIVRSGEVIPYVVSVVKKAKQADLPAGEWVWNKSGVDIIVDKKTFAAQDESKAKTLSHFLSSIGVMGAKLATTEKLVAGGLPNAIKLIAYGTKTKLTETGLGPTQADNLRSEILKALQATDLPTLMYASMKFTRGWGLSRFIALLSQFTYDEVLEASKAGQSRIPALFKQVHGLGPEMATDFAKDMVAFDKWKTNLSKAVKLGKYKVSIPDSWDAPEQVHGPLSGKVFVFSKVRDAELSETIVANGGTIGSSVNNATTHLIVPNLRESSSKIISAKEKGVQLLTLDTAWKLVKG